MNSMEQDRRRKARGRYGEDRAADYLTRRGFRVRARNHFCRVGEVDLIAERDELLCFVEVRARKSAAFASPEATVSRSKQRKVVLAAMDYVRRHELRDRAIRFDVIAVTGDEVLHIENAFDAGM